MSSNEVTSTYGERGPWLKTLPDGPLNDVDERWILLDTPSSQMSGLTTQRKVQGDLISPVPVQEPPYAGKGCPKVTT